jgi:hypothetical protein
MHFKGRRVVVVFYVLKRDRRLGPMAHGGGAAQRSARVDLYGTTSPRRVGADAGGRTRRGC